MDFDLIIVGLGPVGAVAANLAGQAGLRTLVVDKSPTVYDKPRAMGFDQEIMRILANLGIADRIAQYVMPYRPSEYRTTDTRVIRRIDAAAPPYQLGWAPNYVFMQPQIEGILRDNLAGYPSVRVELGAEATAVESHDDAASVTISLASGEQRTFTAGHVLACDGGTSPIRTRLGLDMEDLDFDEPWLVVDVMLKDGAGESLPATNVQYCEIARPSTFVVGPGRCRRWEFMINANETPAEACRPEFVKKLISRWLADDEYEIWRASAYRFHALVLRRWRAGRIFFLGDAAHMTPPFLAQGMCQGIRDASNLVWKLAMVTRGKAGTALLDSYQAERLPHVKRTTLVTKELGKLICERDPVAASARDERLHAEMAANPQGMVRQSLIPGLSDGFLSASSDGPRGLLFPQPRVRTSTGDERLLDDVTGATFRLAVDARTDVATVAQLRQACDRLQYPAIRFVSIGPDALAPDASPDTYQDVSGVLTGWMAQHDCRVVLARPDHYVYGGCREPHEALALLDELVGALATNGSQALETPATSL